MSKELTEDEEEAVKDLLKEILKKKRTIKTKDPRIIALQKKGFDVSNLLKEAARQYGYSLNVSVSSVSTAKRERKVIVKSIKPRQESKKKEAAKKGASNEAVKKQKETRTEASKAQEEQVKFVLKQAERAKNSKNLKEISEAKGVLLLALRKGNLNPEQKQELTNALRLVDERFEELGATSLSLTSREKQEGTNKSLINGEKLTLDKIEKMSNEELAYYLKQNPNLTNAEKNLIMGVIEDRQREAYFQKQESRKQKVQENSESTRREDEAITSPKNQSREHQKENKNKRKPEIVDKMERYGLSVEQLLEDYNDSITLLKQQLLEAREPFEVQKIKRKINQLLREKQEIKKQARERPKPISTIKKEGVTIPFLTKLFKR